MKLKIQKIIKVMGALLLLSFNYQAHAQGNKSQKIPVIRIPQKKTGLCWAASSLVNLEARLSEQCPDSEKPQFSLAYVQYLKWKYLVERRKTKDQNDSQETSFLEGGADLDLFGLLQRNNYQLMLEEKEERENSPVIQLLSYNITDQNQQEVHDFVDTCLLERGLSSEETVKEIFLKFGIEKDSDSLNPIKNRAELDQLFIRFLAEDNKMAIPYELTENWKIYTFSFKNPLTDDQSGTIVPNPDPDAHKTNLGSENATTVSSFEKMLEIIKRELEKGRVVPVSRSDGKRGHTTVVNGFDSKDGKVTKLHIVNSANVKDHSYTETVEKFKKNLQEISIAVQET